MSGIDFLDARRVILLLASVAGVAALSAAYPDNARADADCEVQPGFVSGTAIVQEGKSCTIKATTQPVVSPGAGASSIPAGTTLNQLVVVTPTGAIQIEKGAGIVNTNGGTAFAAFPAAAPYKLPLVPSMSVDGVLASDGATTFVAAESGFILNVGTSSGTTLDSSVIAQYAEHAGGVAAVSLGGLPGNLFSPPAGYYDPATNPTSGNTAVFIGTNGGGGSIVNQDLDKGSAIYVGGTTGDIAITNEHGNISGYFGLFLNTSGHIWVLNGREDGTTAGNITSIGDAESAAVIIGAPAGSLDPVARTPSAIEIRNYAGSTIDGGETGSGILIMGDVSTVPGANYIANHGTIIGSAQQNNTGAAINLVLKTGTGGVTIYNEEGAQIIGDVYLQNSNDTLFMYGGTITGNIGAPTGQGRIVVGGNARLNGGVGSYTGANNAGEAQALDYNFGELLLVDDSTLTVGLNPDNLPYTNNIASSSLATDLATDADGHGSIVFLQATDITHSIGSANMALRGMEFDAGISTIETLDYHVKATNVLSGATLSFPVNQTLHGDLSSSGTIDLGGSTLTLASAGVGASGSFSALAGTIGTSITADGTLSGTGDTGLGRIVADGSVSISSGTTVTIDTSLYSNITSGARYILASGGSEAVLGTTNVAVSGNWNWGLLRGDSLLLGQSANDIYLVADPASLAKATFTALMGSGSSSANVINTLGDVANDTGNAAGQLLFNSLAGLTSADQVEAALTQLMPDTSGGANAGATGAVGAVSNVVGGHSDAITVALGEDEETGISAGDNLLGLGFWAQPFGYYGDQDRRGGLDGYKARSGGLAAGFDAQLSEDLVAGLALAYGNTSVQNEGSLAGNSTRVGNYQATVYGVFQHASWYLESQLAYAYQQFDTSRFVTVGSLAENPRGSFSGDVGSAKFGGGWKATVAGLNVVPNASLTYMYLKQDAYTETNAPTAALAMDESRSTSLRSSLGITLSRNFELQGGKLRPELRLAWLHEFHNAAPTSTAQFAFGSSSFTSTGAQPAKDAFAPGLGLTWLVSDELTISANYDAEIKDRYLGNTGTLKVRYDF